MIYDNSLACTEMSKEDPATSLNWFYNQVKTGAVWDIKLQGMWQNQFPAAVKYRDSFVLNGRLIAPEALGNITYGYWGRAIGYGRDLLYWGGGFADQLNTNPTLTKLQVVSLPILTDADKWYGDGPDVSDHYNITWGIEWYNSNHTEWYNSESLSINFNPTVLIIVGTTPNILDNLLK